MGYRISSCYSCGLDGNQGSHRVPGLGTPYAAGKNKKRNQKARKPTPPQPASSHVSEANIWHIGLIQGQTPDSSWPGPPDMGSILPSTAWCRDKVGIIPTTCQRSDKGQFLFPKGGSRWTKKEKEKRKNKSWWLAMGSPSPDIKRYSVQF